MVSILCPSYFDSAQHDFFEIKMNIITSRKLWEREYVESNTLEQHYTLITEK